MLDRGFAKIEQSHTIINRYASTTPPLKHTAQAATVLHYDAFKERERPRMHHGSLIDCCAVALSGSSK
jgi:hypothetical protein